MSWEETTAAHTIFGQQEVVMRTGFVMEFYGDEALHSVGLDLFDEIHGWIPKEAKLYVLGKNSTEYKELTPRRFNRLRKTLGALASEGQFYAIKDAEGLAVGDYSIELSIAENPPGTLAVALPLSFVQGREDEAFDAFRGLVDRFPFNIATAGYGFNLAWSRDAEMVGEPVQMRTALRHHGLMVRNRIHEGTLHNQLKSAHWLTFIQADLAETLGGLETLGSLEGVSTHPVGHGLLLRAGKAPPVGDINRQALDLGPMKTVNSALQSLRIEEWFQGTTHLAQLDDDDVNGWLSRMDH